MPSSINTSFTFTFSDHLHDILYESETAPRLPGCGGEGTRRIAHPFESTARLLCGPAEIWTTFRSFRIFTRANRRRVGRRTSACRKPERHTRLVFRVEHSPSTRDDVLARAKLTAFTTAHSIDYWCQSENGSKTVRKWTHVPLPLAVRTIENVKPQPA